MWSAGESTYYLHCLQHFACF